MLRIIHMFYVSVLSIRCVITVVYLRTMKTTNSRRVSDTRKIRFHVPSLLQEDHLRVQITMNERREFIKQSIEYLKKMLTEEGAFFLEICDLLPKMFPLTFTLLLLPKLGIFCIWEPSSI